MFNNANHVAVYGDAINIVRGDQHNRHIVVKISLAGKGAKQSSEYRQVSILFHEIILGDIQPRRELYTENVEEREERWTDKLYRLITRKNVDYTVQRTIFIAELNSHPNQTFTVMSFKGQRARRVRLNAFAHRRLAHDFDFTKYSCGRKNSSSSRKYSTWVSGPSEMSPEFTGQY
ncbi:hypothetical protein VNI00_006714 [Paramarasmius palmivorus]|uniref:Uncharacterized protein n=1 Tax=Paramarasmius palmivorus TaxID=297713 RepID=A0AAW0D7H1_9AGAR